MGEQAAPVIEVRTDRATVVLQQLESALAAGDGEAAAALAAPGQDADLRGLAANADALDVRDLDLRLVEADQGLSAQLPEGEWAVTVEATWRFAPYDERPARAEVTLGLETDDAGEVTVTGFGAGDRRLPLWLSGPVTVRRGPDWLVLADGPVEKYLPLVRRALPPVRAAIRDWRGALVLEIPSSGAELDHTLGQDPGTFSAIAAVTTHAGANTGTGTPVHVFVNPDVMGGLKTAGAQVVMTHEVTHLATDAVDARMPHWLLEGYADHVALAGTRLPISTTASQIIELVRKDGVPEALPGPEEFDRQATHLGAWYEAAWRAVEVLAAAGDEATLLGLYRRAATGEDLDTLLREEYGFGLEELTSRWQADLRRIAG